MLSKIIEQKRKELQTLKLIPSDRSRKIHNPFETLKKYPVIAEVKKASPSLGDINLDVDILHQAKNYKDGKAGAISVLTDTKFFKGSFSYLKEIADNIDLPILCKDFIISKQQIDMAYISGADIVLLILKILSKKEFETLFNYAKSLNLYVLTELHDFEEIEKASDLKLDLLGVNSRDLDTLKIDKEKAQSVLKKLDGSYFKVAESGIETVEDVIDLKKAGADAFLIGSLLMRSKNSKEKLDEIYSGLKCL
jgi:indole-3-glycerol phosphate synthase